MQKKAFVSTSHSICIGMIIDLVISLFFINDTGFKIASKLNINVCNMQNQFWNFLKSFFYTVLWCLTYGMKWINGLFVMWRFSRLTENCSKKHKWANLNACGGHFASVCRPPWLNFKQQIVLIQRQWGQNWRSKNSTHRWFLLRSIHQ